MHSGMVPKQSYPDNTLNSHSATRFALTSDLKKPPTWCPREGRNQSYVVWQAYIMAIADEMDKARASRKKLANETRVVKETRRQKKTCKRI